MPGTGRKTLKYQVGEWLSGFSQRDRNHWSLGHVGITEAIASTEWLKCSKLLLKDVNLQPVLP